MATCSEKGCEKPVFAKGLCTAHYQRARRKRGSGPVKEYLPAGSEVEIVSTKLPKAVAGELDARAQEAGLSRYEAAQRVLTAVARGKIKIPSEGA